MSVFSNPAIIETLNSKFIPVAGNNWYHVRRKDAVGAFYKKVTDQGPRGDTKGTRQGHYVFSAGGELLAYNNNRALDRREAFIAEGLRNWEALPEKDRTAGGVEIPEEGVPDSRFVHNPPAGGLILDVHTRALERDADAPSRMRATTSEEVQGSYAALDHLWLREHEWKALVALGESTGEMAAGLPEWFLMRLLRYHLIDNTRGEPPFWGKDQVRRQNLTIRKVGTRSYEISGGTLLQADADGQGTERGYEAAVLGFIETSKEGAVTRFDLVALGDHWGQGQYVYGAREGSAPVGIAFRLGSGEKERDRIRPQGSHHMDGYWRAEEGW